MLTLGFSWLMASSWALRREGALCVGGSLQRRFCDTELGENSREMNIGSNITVYVVTKFQWTLNSLFAVYPLDHFP